MENSSQNSNQDKAREYIEQMEEEKSKVEIVSELRNQTDEKCKSSDEILTIDQLQLGEKGRKEDLAFYIKMLSNHHFMRREIEQCNNKFCRELKSKIEQTMDLAPKTILISKLLSQILSDAVAFDQERHSKLIELLIDTIKVIEKSGDSLFCSKQAASVLMQIIVDFLYRLKDRHPYSNSEMEGTMNVLDIILEFLIPNGYLPSAALFKEYSESELTKNFNTLPPLEYLNSKFDEYYQMSEEAYELLRMRLNSRPPFVFFFNPSIQLQESMNMDSDIYKLGFFAKPYSNQIGAGMYITNYGWMYRGYFYSNSQNIYGKLIYSKEAYKGGWNRGFKDGKGEFEYFQEERVEVGQWVGEFRQGEFECYDNNGRLTHIKIYKNDVEIKKEDVSDEIYRNK